MIGTSAHQVNRLASAIREDDVRHAADGRRTATDGSGRPPRAISIATGRAVPDARATRPTRRVGRLGWIVLPRF